MTSRAHLPLILALALLALLAFPAHGRAAAPFGPIGFTARSLDSGGDDFTVAGGHPYEATTSFAFPSFLGEPANLFDDPIENVRNIWVELPPGFVGAAAAARRCPLTRLQGLSPEPCPADTQVGTLTLIQPGNGNVAPHPLYNMVPEKGYPAEFAFKFLSNAVVSYPQVRPRGGGYGLNITVPGASRFRILGISATLWGVPSQHPGLEGQPPLGGPPIPFLSNPTNCSEAEPTTRIYVDSWEHPASMLPDGTPDLSDANWKAGSTPNPPVTGCSDPALTSQWDPTISVAPVQEGPIGANAPSGLKVHLHLDQSNDPTDPAYISGLRQYDPETPQAPELKTATVALPEGMAISPSGANGLVACSDQASLPQGDQVRYDDILPVTCPDSSKIGTITATSPLLAAHDPETDAVTGPEPVTGDVYILAPHPGDLPAGGGGDGKYRLLIQIENERLGLNVKLPGVAVANKSTGQLTATFTENPQLPVKDLDLEFFKGPRAALSTPKTCGTFTTTTDLEAWSAPGTPNAHPESSFELGAGSGCASSLGARPFAPKLDAGTTNSKAGSSAPFVLNLSRDDSEQEFSSLDVSLPKGLLASLKGIPYCSEAAIAAARSRTGAAEQANPTCPGSQVGTLTTSAGPGQNPYTVPGKAYLAGPYKGALLSFAFIAPAVAGPFDLGNVVVRAAAFIDPESAQVTVKTDPLPQILDGVPLGIRSIQAKIDRPHFTRNPTNCEAMAISATLAGSNGASASPSNHFQVGECRALHFKPKLAIKLKGGTSRSDHPALTAVLKARPGDANIAETSVALPHSEFLAQDHIRTVCTRVQFNAGAGNGAQCPKGSIYGKASATTPLLDEPLRGPVYLRSSDNPLPDLVVALHGQIDFNLVGRIDSKNGGIRTSFESVPDAPVSKFVLQMQGGKKGLLENSRNLCRSTNRASVQMEAQNGRVADSRPRLRSGCKQRK